jgi:DNA (cytosine-5)-methyltransferase 1
VSTPPLVLSLFPGIGLLDMAFEQEGFCVVRGPDLLWGGDIHRFHPPAGKFDGIIGGPPCQSFSPLVHLLRATGREPKHPNQIHEYERCVSEAEPGWFVMENVPNAPTPSVKGYDVNAILLCPTRLDSGDGFGHEQRRLRRFSFGVRGVQAVDLRRWIDFAALELPDQSRTLTQWPVSNDYESKHRTKVDTVLAAGFDAGPRPREKRATVTGDPREVSVVIGGSGKKKATVRAARQARRSIEECCELQGLPRDFLADAPFTKDEKHRVVGNGVPLPMGRAVAKAVKRAMGYVEDTEQSA